MTPSSQPKRRLPLALVVVGIVGGVWLLQKGKHAMGFAEGTGEGLLGALICLVGLWALMTALLAFMLFRRAFTRARYRIYLILLALFGLGPPTLVVCWLIELAS